jgi:F-type H+-transporting ATPase subunit delta
MDNVTFARPYAKAAFEVAVANKATAAWLRFLEEMQTYVADAQVQACLDNPHMTPERLYQLLSELSQQTLTTQMKNFLHLLAVNHRLAIFPQLVFLFKNLLAEQEKKIDVSVASPFPLSEKLQEKLQAVLQKKLQRTVSLHCAIDQSLLGGVVIRAGDLVIDASLRSKLQRLHEALVA